jgi:hypothetical protein
MRESKTDPFELDLMQPGDNPSSLDADLIETLRLIVDNLAEPHRTILEMYYWQRCTKAQVGRAFGSRSNVETARLINRAVDKANQALRLYLEVGKVPTASGRRRTPKAALLVPRSARRSGHYASGRLVPREDLQGAHRTYVVVPHR